jgi:hypothetical protein
MPSSTHGITAVSKEMKVSDKFVEFLKNKNVYFADQRAELREELMPWRGIRNLTNVKFRDYN